MKPLTWLWIMFDRSPLGQNAWLGHRLRRLLAERVFKRCGKNVKIWHLVEFSYGYNLSVGDDVVVHRGVLLDDAGRSSSGTASASPTGRTSTRTRTTSTTSARST